MESVATHLGNADRLLTWVGAFVGAALGLFVALVLNPVEAYIVSAEPPVPGVDPALQVDLFGNRWFTRTAPNADELRLEQTIISAGSMITLVAVGTFCGWWGGALFVRRRRRQRFKFVELRQK